MLTSWPAAPADPGRVPCDRRLFAALPLGLALCAGLWGLRAAGVQVFPLFVLGFVFMALSAYPRRLLSPLSFVHIYYGVWYVIAPLFAQRYADEALQRPEIQLALCFLFTGYLTCVLACLVGELAIRAPSVPSSEPSRSQRSLLAPILCLYGVATLMVVMIVASSGGLQVWVADPGDAFLNRQGSGLYVILSHFSSMMLAALTGAQAYRRRKPGYLLVFVAWLLLTSPVHGSKFQIILLLVLSLLPWVRHVKPLSGKSFLMGLSFVAIFVLGLYFRNHSWIEVNTFLPYALNYFTTLDNFALSLADMGPGVLQTFFLPFHKLASPVGVPDTSFYFDMNHVLTDIYFPHAWAIRATEQWPVEKDLYLNFGFFAGLPLLFGYLLTLTAIYRWAEHRDTLGLWFVSATLTLLLVSHLRGSLYNFNDFYMYPYLALACYLMRKVSLRRPAPAPHARAIPPTPAAG